MGKLIDTLLKSAKSTGPSIGFTGSGNQAKAKATAIVVTAKSVPEAKQAADAGADIIIVPSDIETQDLTTLDAVWGVDLRFSAAVSQAKQKSLIEQGAGFLLFGTQTPARTLAEPIEHIERMLLIDPPQDDPLMISYRSFNDVDIDVVVIDTKLSPTDLKTMSVTEFARIRSWVSLMRFPTILTLNESPTEGDIITAVKLRPQALWLLKSTPDSILQVRKELEQIPREKDSIAVSAAFNTGMEQRRPQ